MHIKDVAENLTVHKAAMLSVKLKKCRLCKQEVEYLRQFVQPGEVSIETKNCRIGWGKTAKNNNATAPVPGDG